MMELTSSNFAKIPAESSEISARRLTTGQMSQPTPSIAQRDLDSSLSSPSPCWADSPVPASTLLAFLSSGPFLFLFASSDFFLFFSAALIAACAFFVTVLAFNLHVFVEMEPVVLYLAIVFLITSLPLASLPILS